MTTKKIKVQERVRMLLQERCVLKRELYPSIYTGSMAVWGSISGGNPACYRLCILSRHRHPKEWPRGAGGGAPAPRVWPQPDWLHSPLPLRGGSLVGPGLLLGWFCAQIIWVDGSFYYSFVQFSVTLVGMRLLVYFSMYSGLSHAK
jgi:hypothetical protein